MARRSSIPDKTIEPSKEAASPIAKVERFHFIKYADDSEKKIITNRDYRNSRLVDANGKGITFEKCDFSYSIFERAYFRDAVFRQCKFVGVRFIDSNLRQAHFSRCDLSYAEFLSTVLEVRDVVASLPIQPNMRSDVLRSLKVNAASTDDYEGRSFLVLEQIRATEAHLTKAVVGTESYYQEKYNTLWSRVRAASQLLLHRASGAIWGHGERPLRLIWSIVALLTAFAVVDATAMVFTTDAKAVSAFTSAWMHVANLFLGVSSARPTGVLEQVDYAVYIARPVYI